LKFEYHGGGGGGGGVGGGERAQGTGLVVSKCMMWGLFAAGNHNGNCMVTLVAAVQETCVIGSGSTHPH
jgi:hypothetical protein